MSHKETVMAFGEILWDSFPRKGKNPAQKIIGGAPFNFIYRVNSIGDKGLMVSRLGTDDLGNKALDEVKRLGLDTKFIQIDDEHPTGIVKISADSAAAQAYQIFQTVGGKRVAYDLIELTPELQNAAQQVDCFCYGTLAQRHSKSRETLTTLLDSYVPDTALKFCDVNLRNKCYSPETVKYSIDKANALKLSEEEVGVVAQTLRINFKGIADFSKKIIQRSELDYCIVTLAEKGAYAMAESGEEAYVPGIKVEPAHSVGAGDAFSAGFVYRILRGGTLKGACEVGNVLGGLVASRMGATCKVTRDDIGGFILKGQDRITHPEFK